MTIFQANDCSGVSAASSVASTCTSVQTRKPPPATQEAGEKCRDTAGGYYRGISSW